MAKLGDIATIQSGGTPARSIAEYWEDGTIPWVKISDIKSKHLNQTEEMITEAGLENSSAKIFPKGTILYTIFATLGETSILDINAATNQAIAGISITDSRVLPDYLYYYLLSQKIHVQKIGRGVAQNNINMKLLRDFDVPLPSKEAQLNIIEQLNRVTELLFLRKQQLTKLDELIKARFVEMFGDPANNPHKWKTLSFKQAGVRLSDGPFGSNLKSAHYTDSGVRVIRLGNIGVGKFIDNDRSYISLSHYECLKKYTCRAGEIVIGTLGDPNLRACIIPSDIKYAVNKADCVHYIPNPTLLNTYFVCQYINCPETLLLATKMIHGQTRSRVSSGQLAQLPIFVPPLSLQNQFADFVAEVDKSKVEVQKALDQTQLLFDSLMQQYFG